MLNFRFSAFTAAKLQEQSAISLRSAFAQKRMLANATHSAHIAVGCSIKVSIHHLYQCCKLLLFWQETHFSSNYIRRQGK